MPTVEAIPLILKSFPDILIRFAGMYYPQGYDTILKQRAIELGVENNLEIVGMLPWLDNFKRTAQAHIGCVFYEDNLNNRVTIPNRLFEYMYCGVAVLGHDFPEVRKVIEDTGCGVLVDSSSPESIAEGALEIIKDPEEMLEMGRRGKKAILEKYEFSYELEKLVKFYSEIMMI